MGKGIKTRQPHREIKTLNRSTAAARQMKQSLLHIKEKASQSTSSSQESPGEYAAEHITGAANSTRQEVFSRLDRYGRSSAQTVRGDFMRAKEIFQRERAAAKLRKAHTPATSPKQSRPPLSDIRPGHRSKPAYNTRNTARSAAAVGRRSKSAHQSADAARKAVQASRSAAKSAQRLQRTRKAAQAAAAKAKSAGKAVVSCVRILLTAAKALVTALLAGGWIAVLVVVLICLCGLLLGSDFGIFFAGEDSGSGQTLHTAIREIDAAYWQQLDDLKSAHSYDVLETTGSRADWKEILAVYAVKTAAAADGAQPVAVMDDSNKLLLTDIFWQMNQISCRTDSVTETIIETSEDDEGNIIETEVTVTRTYLYITIRHKSAWEMAAQFGFDTWQNRRLAELLSPEMDGLWAQLLHGVAQDGNEIVTVALSQVGNTGGEPYWRWYGFQSRVEWCACFVSWCADQCGYIENGTFPKFSVCATQGVPWFQSHGRWKDAGYIPQPGDIIFFDWDDGGQDGISDHVGIVEKTADGKVYTIEGNFGDACCQNSYPLGHYEIYGYGLLS